MKSNILSLVCLSLLMTSIQTQKFDLKKFYGRWYEIAHDEDHPYIDDDATNVTLDFEEQPGAEFRMVLSYLEDGE
jgi:lipocalin